VTPTMFGMDGLAYPQIEPIVLNFPILLALRNGGELSGNGENCFFRPANF